MRRGVHLLQLRANDGEVLLRGLQFGVTDRAGVRKDVQRHVLFDLRSTERRKKDVGAHVRLVHPPAFVRDEENATLRTRGDAHLTDVPAHERAGDLTGRHHAILLPLPLPDEDYAASEIDVTEFEAHEFPDAQARGVEHFEHGTIAQHLFGRGRGEELLHLGLREVGQQRRAASGDVNSPAEGWSGSRATPSDAA